MSTLPSVIGVPRFVVVCFAECGGFVIGSRPTVGGADRPSGPLAYVRAATLAFDWGWEAVCAAAMKRLKTIIFGVGG